jgi:hypothetical protein
MHPVHATSWSCRLAILTLCVSLLGCATQLAPAYDQAIVDGLRTSSAAAMTLLASVSGGTKPGTFATREDSYSAVIGQLDALGLFARVRPMPDNQATKAIDALLAKRGAPALSGDGSTPPSADAIAKIAQVFTKMRDTDRRQGLTAFEVGAFRGMVQIYFDQAITYESFLQR